MDEKKIGKFIRDRRKERGLTQRDIANGVGVTEASVSRWESGEINNMRRDRIAKLAELLDISPLALLNGPDAMNIRQNRIPRKNYGLQTVSKVVGRDVKLVPRIGVIACGRPILADENLDGYEYVDNHVNADFALICHGDSMVDAGIKDGYTVFIKYQADVDDGGIAAVLIGDEATLKRVYHTDKGIILSPMNKDYKPMVLSKNDERIQILGKAVAIKGEL